MSVHAVSAAWLYRVPELKSSKLRAVASPVVKLVLVKLADQANDAGICWPKWRSIADECELHRSTVAAAVAYLEAAGALERFRRTRDDGGKSSNVYLLRLPGLAAPSLAELNEAMAEIRGFVSPTSHTATSPRRNVRRPHVAYGDVKNHKKEPESSTDVELARRRPRPRDPIFEELVSACYPNAGELTATARGRVNKAVKELKDIGASVEQVRAVVKAYKRHPVYGKALLTPQALTGAWPLLEASAPSSAKRGKAAEAFVRNVGVHLPERALLEELKSFELEPYELDTLFSIWRGLQAEAAS